MLMRMTVIKGRRGIATMKVIDEKSETEFKFFHRVLFSELFSLRSGWLWWVRRWLNR